MATTCSAQQADPGSLLEVILTTDLGTQKHFVSNLGLRGALSLRATCRNAASLIDQLLSEPLQLTFENISNHNLDDTNHSGHRSWHDAVTVALRAASKWPHCTNLSLTALARPGDPRIRSDSSSNLDFVPGPLLAAATTPGCKPLVHITALRLHVDAAPPRPAAANDAAGAAAAAAGDPPRAVEVRSDPIVQQRQCDRDQHLQLLLWLSRLGRLEQHDDGSGALGGASQLTAQPGQAARSGGGPPWPQPQRLAAAAAAAATTAGRFAAMAAAAGAAAATAAAGQPRQAAPRWRCAAPPLDLTHGLLSALARLFPSLECISLSGHWAAAPSEPAPDLTSRRAGGGGGSTSSTDRGGAGLGPLAALAPLRRLRRLELPAALVLSGGEPGGGAAAVSGLAALASVSPSLEELVIRTDCQHQALRQRTQLAWPRALLAVAPQLTGLTLIGGYSRVAGVLLQDSHGGPAAAVAAAGPPPPPPPPLRLALVDHLAFLPEPLSVQTLMLEPREGWLLLAAPLGVRSLAACLRLFGAGPAAAAAAPVPAAVGATAAAGAGAAVAGETVAVAPAGAGAAARSAGAREADGAGGSGGLRCVAASCLLLNRAPAEGDWRLLEAFTARPDCALAVRELTATYPECGGGAAAGAAAGREASGREAAGSGLDGGPRGRSNLARALALSASRCERLELRLPGGDLALLAAVVREVGELPPGLLPAEEGSVVVEVMGGPTAAAVEAEEAELATVAGAEAEVDSVLAAALEPYGHLRGLGF
ncbi:hypothetical protein PLESTF_001914800 [Pleodorina starrii]|nr:hypothetical protein PLESTF_001914800 [Pleodorina starrii]